MRYLLTIGALAVLLAGSSRLAVADQIASNQHSTTVAATSGAPDPSAQPETPDVQEWTGTLAQQQTVTAQHLTRHGHVINRFASRILARTSKIANNLTRSALRFLGTPYVFGGTSSRSGFDCSGYTQHVFGMLGISLPRMADEQYYAGKRATGGPKPGDLVFFQTYTSGPSHVGIYIGNGKFVHASSSHGVMVSNLTESYWATRYLGAKRYIKSSK